VLVQRLIDELHEYDGLTTRERNTKRSIAAQTTKRKLAREEETESQKERRLAKHRKEQQNTVDRIAGKSFRIYMANVFSFQLSRS
jgi:hypothetical protein